MNRTPSNYRIAVLVQRDDLVDGKCNRLRRTNGRSCWSSLNHDNPLVALVWPVGRVEDAVKGESGATDCRPN